MAFAPGAPESITGRVEKAGKRDMYGKGPLFVYTMTILGIACALPYPFVSVLVYIIFAVMSPNSLWFYSLSPTFFNSGVGFSAAVGYPMIAGWVLQHCGNFRIGKAQLPLWLLIFYLVWATFVTQMAGMTPLGHETLMMMLRLLIALVIALTLCESMTHLRLIIWSIIFASGFVAYELNMSYLAGFNRLQIVGYAGMDNNFFAVAMVVGTTIAVFTGLVEKNYALKGLAFMAALFQAHAILFSMSRGGMLGLCVVGLVAFLLLPKTLTNVSLFTVIVAMVLFLAGPSVQERFWSSFEDQEELDGSAKSRIESWKNCAEVIRQRPIMGIGIQNWAAFSRAHFGIFLEAHNTWLQSAAETGIPGGLLLLGFVLVTMWRVLPLARGKIDLPDPMMRMYAQMVIAAMSGYCVSAWFVSLYFMEIVYYTCLIGLCCLKLVHMKQRREDDERMLHEALQQETLRLATVAEKKAARLAEKEAEGSI